MPILCKTLWFLQCTHPRFHSLYFQLWHFTFKGIWCLLISAVFCPFTSWLGEVVLCLAGGVLWVFIGFMILINTVVRWISSRKLMCVKTVRSVFVFRNIILPLEEPTMHVCLLELCTHTLCYEKEEYERKCVCIILGCLPGCCCTTGSHIKLGLGSKVTVEKETMKHSLTNRSREKCVQACSRSSNLHRKIFTRFTALSTG